VFPDNKMPTGSNNNTARHDNNRILQERLLNVPESVTRLTNKTTPSTISNSHLSNHVHFDHDSMARNDCQSLLALAYMPPESDDEDVRPRRSQRLLTALEEEQQHDLDQLAGYEGDSDDKGDGAAELLVEVSNETSKEDKAPLLSGDGYTLCDGLTDVNLKQQQARADVPLLTPGAPPGWVQPTKPEGWKPQPKKTNLGEPDTPFASVNTPGGWDEFTYRPKFLYKNRKAFKHLYYAMPEGARPVPKDKHGKRKSNGFEFFYNGWMGDKDCHFCSGATRDNFFPECQKGCLDAALLKKLRLTKARMTEPDGAPDALWFFQLLLPIHDMRSNGTVEGDPQKPYHPHVAECTELCAISSKLRGSGRGHRFAETSPAELVKWDGVLIFDGVLEGSKGAMLRRWDCCRDDNGCFNKRIYDSMPVSRWLQIKKCIKLNNNMTATKPGDANYDPTQKYDYIYSTIVHNTNVLTKDAGLDQCRDETTWMNASWAEPGSGIIRRGLEKPGGSEGGQLVVISDVDRI